MASNDEHPSGEDADDLIDPSLLAHLSEYDRNEALAAAASARRAEKRAFERGQREEQRIIPPTLLLRRQSSSVISAEARGVVDEEEEEERALAEALERRMIERQEREVEMEKRRMATLAMQVGIVAENGMVEGRAGEDHRPTFVSKEQRGMGQVQTMAGEGKSNHHGGGGNSRSSMSASGPVGNGNNTSSQKQRQQQTESHLTSSQLASIKKAYLGEKAVAASIDRSGINNSSTRNGQSNDPHTTQAAVRQQLREQRQKRRKKTTTFKFEWGAEEDTFDDPDDPLYGGIGSSSGVASSSSSKNPTHRQQQQLHTSPRGIGRPNDHRQHLPLMSHDDDGIKFGNKNKKMRSNYDTVATVHTVATKPLERMTPRDWRIYRENYNIVVKGGKSPPPMRSFREMPMGVPSIHPILLDAIENRLKYTNPSPIQRQAIPIGMQRRDMIGIAETGSGKTAAFGVPLCHHILSFPNTILDTVADEGPLALVMAPTRELALQINVEFGKLLACQGNVVSLAVVGGQSITEQATKLRNGVHVVVGTPGRINDCVEMTYLVLNQCSYIVLDEADRMIDLGFAPQIEQILDAMGARLKSEDETEAYKQEREDLERPGKAVPSHRLTAMFSATMPAEVERIAKRYLRFPVVVSVGDQDSGKNARIKQVVMFLSSPGQKESTLRDILRRAHTNEKIIVFVNEKKNADGVGRMVERSGRQCVVLHGGKTQDQREENLALFRRGGVVLVATDVAGRGLDIPDVNQVINYDLPTRSIDNYCHRIGRTGRAGKEGIATSFITDEDDGIMAPLKQYLESTGMPVPDRLKRHPAATGGTGDFIR